jgi:hypothetical protein
MYRFMTLSRSRSRATKWTGFVAGLWLPHRMFGSTSSLLRVTGRAALRLGFGIALLAMPGCSELASPSGVMPPSGAMPPGTEPPYVSLAAKYLQSALTDQAAYDGFEITGVRWVHAIHGWNFLTCVHFHDHGHLRTYALFIQDGVVVDARYAVETDACETQVYTPFDLLTGTLGRPTAPRQPPLY